MPPRNTCSASSVSATQLAPPTGAMNSTTQSAAAVQSAPDIARPGARNSTAGHTTKAIQAMALMPNVSAAAAAASSLTQAVITVFAMPFAKPRMHSHPNMALRSNPANSPARPQTIPASAVASPIFTAGRWGI